MKKIVILMAVLFLSLAISGCSATTITEQAGNYIYTQGEEIRILDIDTRNTVGVLTVTGAEVLLDEPFFVYEPTGKDKNGNDLLDGVVYAQLIQVFYTYDNKDTGKQISSHNFYVYDEEGVLCEEDPEVVCTPKQREGEEYFLIATKNASSFLDLQFNYGMMQVGSTAKIQLHIPNASKTTTTTTTETVPSKTTTQLPSTKPSTAPTQPKAQETTAQKPVDTQMILFAVIVILVVAVVGLTAAVLVLLHRNK